MRKRILRTCLAAVLLCAVLPVTAAFAENATVTGSDVNMRYGPGTGYDVVECLPRGAVVTVIDRSNGSWYAISYNGQDGYMSSRYLSLEEEEAAEITESSTTADGFINAMYVNFRSAPSSSASILGQYNKGKIVKVNGYSGDWAYVTIDGEDGYVYRSYVTPGFASESDVNYVFSGADDVKYAEEYVEPTPTPAPTEKPEEPAATPEPATEATPEPVSPTPTPATEAPSGSYKGHITGDYVRFRTGPSTNYSIIDSYNKGKELAAIAQEGDWVKAVIDGREGYVYAQYVYIDEQPDIGDIINKPSQPQETAKPEETPAPTPEPSREPEIEETEATAGYICGNDVRFRSGPSMSSDIIGTFYYGNSVTITGTSGDWTAVEYKGSSGFVYSQYVKSGSFSVGGGDSGSDSSSGSGTGRQIADFALQFVGYNYCWGGTSPETGFDCSGLVYYTYKNFGYTLNRVAADQANNGYGVSYDELQPGDILCFYSSGSYIGHVGIYIGDGMFVHASNSTTGVIITPLDGYYSNRGFVARRIIG